jgi:murein L,D-transpeptidase YcbB/YkuD
MRLTEAKLRQIVREELVRDYRKRLQEGRDKEARQERRQARQAARGERKQAIDFIKGEIKAGNITRDDAKAQRKAARGRVKAELQAEFAHIDTQLAQRKLTAAEAVQAKKDAALADLPAEDNTIESALERDARLAELDAELAKGESDQAAKLDIPSSIVKSGSRGDDVTTAQEWVSEAGFEVEVDGKYGGETKMAIKGFQEQEGLKGDGIVGPNTWKALARKQSGGGGEPEPANESKLTKNSLRRLISRELRRI